jgi:hypothetical protein
MIESKFEIQKQNSLWNIVNLETKITIIKVKTKRQAIAQLFGTINTKDNHKLVLLDKEGKLLRIKTWNLNKTNYIKSKKGFSSLKKQNSRPIESPAERELKILQHFKMLSN